MARKQAATINPPTVVEAPGLPEAAKEANTMILTEKYADEQRDIARLIGRREGRAMMARAIQKLYQVTDLVDLQSIKESKKYKGFRTYVDGELVTVTTWAEYCLHIEGKSVEAIDLELNNFKQLGIEFFDSIRQLGIGPSTMRDIRRLPDDYKQALLTVAESGDKDAFVEMAENFIVKNAQEKAALNKKVEEAKADYEALDKVERQTRERMANLERENAKLVAGVALWDAKIMRATDDIGRIGTIADEVFGKHVAFIDMCAALVDPLDPNIDDYRDKLEQARVPIARLGEQIERFAHVVARLRFEFGTRVGGYLDNTHTLTPDDAE